MSGSVWGFLWIMVALKIPLAMLLYIVWWAIRAVPEPVGDGDDDGGQRRGPSPRGPSSRPPRRGPHGDPAAPPPERVRTPHIRARIPAGHR